jgi:hypothetical protein
MKSKKMNASPGRAQGFSQCAALLALRGGEGQSSPPNDRNSLATRNGNLVTPQNRFRHVRQAAGTADGGVHRHDTHARGTTFRVQSGAGESTCSRHGLRSRGCLAQSPVPPRLARCTECESASRCDSRGAFDVGERPSRMPAVGVGRDSLALWEPCRQVSRQVAPELTLAGTWDRRARGQLGCPGTRTARAGARTILRHARFRFGDRATIARIEQPQIDEGRGKAGGFHPGVIAAGSSLRRQERAQDRDRKPRHGG